MVRFTTTDHSYRYVSPALSHFSTPHHYHLTVTTSAKVDNEPSTSGNSEASDSKEVLTARIVTVLPKALLAAAVITTGFLAARYLDAATVARLYREAKSNPGQSLPWFFLLNVAAVVMLVPGALIQLFAGAVYGVTLGSLVSWSGTFMGQCVAFFLGRHLWRDSLASFLVHRFPRFTTIETAIFANGSSLVFLLRLSPVLPDSLMNYALALTSISFQLFAVATAATMVPYTLLYCYLGSASTDIVSTLKGGDMGDVRIKIAITLVSVVTFGGILVYIAIILKRAIQQASEEKATAAAAAATGGAAAAAAAAEAGSAGIEARVTLGPSDGGSSDSGSSRLPRYDSYSPAQLQLMQQRQQYQQQLELGSSMQQHLQQRLQQHRQAMAAASASAAGRQLPGGAASGSAAAAAPPPAPPTLAAGGSMKRQHAAGGD